LKTIKTAQNEAFPLKDVLFWGHVDCQFYFGKSKHPKAPKICFLEEVLDERKRRQISTGGKDEQNIFKA
jgi:hypothetical protein